MAAEMKQAAELVSPKRESGLIISKNDDVAGLAVVDETEGYEKGVREKDISPLALASMTSLVVPPDQDIRDGQALSLDLLLAHLDSLIEKFETSSFKSSPSDRTEYEEDDFLFCKEREEVFFVEKYLERQGELSTELRAQMVDWIVQVQAKFYLFTEELYLGRPAAVGRSAISIATKYDDETAPSVVDLLSICEEAYNHKELVAMEIKVFQTLTGEIGAPLSYHYLNWYARGGQVRLKTLTLARYILEISLLDYSLVDRKESKMAAAALLQALRMKGLSWDAKLYQRSGYDDGGLRALQQRMNSFLVLQRVSSLMATREKYSDESFYGVALLPLLADESS
ncbi:G2/mitotic-specific cyclin-B3-like [Haemaphysalis longicornis]